MVAALRLVALAPLLAWLAGCASTQSVRIECVPEQVRVYVDGRLLEAGESDSVVLRTDAPHKIYVKGPGYTPRLVVLEPQRDAEGRESLGPDTLCIEVVPVGMGRNLELHVDDDAEP